MKKKNIIVNWIILKFGQWLLKTDPPRRSYLSDFHTICEEVKPGDVLLIEGRSRAGKIIQYVTLSPWSHAILYLGRLDEIEDPEVREKVSQHWHKQEKNPRAQLMKGSVDPTVPWDNDKATVVALREIAAGHTDFSDAHQISDEFIVTEERTETITITTTTHPQDEA